VVATGTLCRGEADICDAEEHCNGSNTCPADIKKPSTTVCRGAVVGGCDLEEKCTGSADACPSDAVVPSGTECRVSAGDCDPAESCDGSNACPADAKFGAETVCRAEVLGGCDIEEACNGTDDVCPEDIVESDGTECRGSQGDCDVIEECDGIDSECPADAKEPTTTVCRGVAGICDVAENCAGGNDCPVDAFEPASTECRGDAGDCDVAEACTGTGALCPTDMFDPELTACGNGSDTVCDNPDTCNATGQCQVRHEPTTLTCRNDAGECDVEEKCDANGLCPADSFEPSGTECGDDSDTLCDNADSCDGSGTCLINREPSGTTCRPAVGDCDMLEACDGTDVDCPANTFKPVDTACGNPGDTDCDNPDRCDAVGSCLPRHEPNTVLCRPTAGGCDVADNCDGSGACSADAVQPNGTVCRAQVPGGCDIAAELCDGATNGCPSDTLQPDYFPSTTPDSTTCTDDYCLGGLVSHPDNGSCVCTCTPGQPFTVSNFDSVFDWNGNTTTPDLHTILRSPVLNGTYAAASATTSGAPAVSYVQIIADAGEIYDLNMSIKAPSTPRSMASLSQLQLVMSGSNATENLVSVALSTSATMGTGFGAYVALTPYVAFSGVTGYQTFNMPLSVFGIAELSQVQQVGIKFDAPGATKTWRIDSIVVNTPVQDCEYPDGASCGCTVATADRDCDDGNPCTIDLCGGSGPNTACTHEPATAGTVCGDQSDTACDNADSCNGAGACVPNHEPTTTTCGDAGDECVEQDFCNGVGACEDNGFKDAGTFCGDDGSECANQDTCNGAGGCVDNGIQLEGTPCGDGATDCSEQDTCDDFGECQANDLGAAFVCRGASGVCDVAETCGSSTGACPVDLFASAGTLCGAGNEACSDADTCNGSGACLLNHKAGSFVCRAAAGGPNGCDVEETCGSSTTACPADVFKADGASCGDGATDCSDQ
ncbi:MAG TPA: hypothetical protein VHO25_08685, partial [Polyangiaceae bacterium]|nr:hypothetical protein [Polyangiaceae bacterium]